MTLTSADRERERIARILPRMFAAIAAGTLLVGVAEVIDNGRGARLGTAVLISGALAGAVLGPPMGRRSTDPRDLDLQKSARMGALFVRIAPLLILTGLLIYRRVSGVFLIWISGVATGLFFTYALTLRRRLPARLAALRGRS